MPSIHRSRAACNQFAVEYADTMEPLDVLAAEERS